MLFATIQSGGVEKLSPENNGVDFYVGLQNNIMCVTFLWEILIHASLVVFLLVIKPKVIQMLSFLFSTLIKQWACR